MVRTRAAQTAGPLLMWSLRPVPQTARRQIIRHTWSDHWSHGPSMPLWSKLNCLRLTSTRFTEPRARSSTSAPMPPVSYTTEKHTQFWKKNREYLSLWLKEVSMWANSYIFHELVLKWQIWLVSPSSSIHFRALCASGPHLLLQLLLSDNPEVEASHQSERQHHPLPGHLSKAGWGQRPLQVWLLPTRSESTGCSHSNLPMWPFANTSATLIPFSPFQGWNCHLAHRPTWTARRSRSGTTQMSPPQEASAAPAPRRTTSWRRSRRRYCTARPLRTTSIMKFLRAGKQYWLELGFTAYLNTISRWNAMFLVTCGTCLCILLLTII